MKKILSLLMLLVALPLFAADVTISALPAASALGGTEVAPIVQSAATVKATINQMSTYINPVGADDQVNVSSGSAWVAKTIPDCTDTGGNHLNYTQSTNAFSCGTTGGGTTSGNFTITWDDACTTSPTTLVRWQLTGSVATWMIAPMSVSSCTSDSTAFGTSTAIIPSQLRPSSGNQIYAVGVRVTDNGTTDNALGCLKLLDTGQVQVTRTSAAGCGGNWTSSGAKAVNSTNVIYTAITYYVVP